jgi:foldase protein PrsA
MDNTEEGKELSDDEILALAKENIVYDIALYDYAKTVGITVDKEFEDSYKQYIDYMKMQYSQYEQLLQMIGYTEKALKQQMQTEYVVQKLIETAPASFMATDAEIKSYYETNKEEFKYDGLKAKHILISTVDENGNPLSDDKKAELKKVVDDIYNQIKKGADFDLLMNEFGEDPGVKSNPDGYVFTKGDMVKEFEEAAYALEVGQVSEPVLSDYGYHIIKLIDKIEYIPYEDVKEEILNKLSTEKVEEMVKMLVKNYTSNWN